MTDRYGECCLADPRRDKVKRRSDRIVSHPTAAAPQLFITTNRLPRLVVMFPCEPPLLVTRFDRDDVLWPLAVTSRRIDYGVVATLFAIPLFFRILTSTRRFFSIPSAVLLS